MNASRIVPTARVLSFILVGIAAALLLTGCGGDSDTDSTADAASEPAAASEDEAGEDEAGGDDDAADEVDEALREAYEKGFLQVGEQLDAVGDRFLAAEDIDDFTAARADLQATIATLDSLTPPEAIATDHTRLYAALRKALVETKKITATSTAASDEAAATAAAAELDTASTAVDAINEELG